MMLLQNCTKMVQEAVRSLMQRWNTYRPETMKECCKLNYARLQSQPCTARSVAIEEHRRRRTLVQPARGAYRAMRDHVCLLTPPLVRQYPTTNKARVLLLKQRSRQAGIKPCWLSEGGREREIYHERSSK
jgi:hypothetical protein